MWMSLTDRQSDDSFLVNMDRVSYIQPIRPLRAIAKTRDEHGQETEIELARTEEGSRLIFAGEQEAQELKVKETLEHITGALSAGELPGASPQKA